MATPEEPTERPSSADWARDVGSQREDQYTPMGQISMFGDFAAGVRRAHGWKKWLGLGMVLLLLAALALGVIWTVAQLLLSTSQS